MDGTDILYTALNLVTAVSAALLLIFGQPMWITVLRNLSSCMLAMTFFAMICVLIPKGGDPEKLLWSGNGLYHHVLCPVIGVISYIIYEHGTHFIFPESLLKRILPIESDLLVRFMFKAGREYPKECRETRRDIDRRLTAIIRKL